MILLRLLFLLPFTLLVRPLSRVWPKDPSLVAFMPREGTRFIDNVAHFYEGLRLRGKLPTNAYLLLSDAEAAREWTALGRKAEFYEPFAPRSLLRYLRTGVVIADSWQWVERGRYACFTGAKLVQLWHGIPLKQIEKSNPGHRKAKTGLRRLLHATFHWMNGRYPTYDIVVSTSEFFEREAFRLSFDARRFVNTGYPRNDCLFESEGVSGPAVDRDDATLAAIERLRREGKRIVVYAPTFRDTGGGPFEDGAIALEALARFAEENQLVFVVKLHPYVAVRPDASLRPHVLVYDTSKDSASLLRISDLLVSDYSSIFFDYLLLDRPIVFFPYDYDKYRKHDRAFLFDYEDYTPGPKCHDQQGLFSTILSALDAPDAVWAARRRALCAKSFSVVDGHASLRLWAELEKLLESEQP